MNGAAELFANPYIQDLLKKLAKWEIKHQELFASLREQLPSRDEESGNLDSDDDLSLYLQAMEGLDVFKTTKDATVELTGNERMKDVLEIALTKEKDAIVYFLALKAFVPTEDGRKKIDGIIDEEMRHIAALNQSLKKHF